MKLNGQLFRLYSHDSPHLSFIRLEPQAVTIKIDLLSYQAS